MPVQTLILFPDVCAACGGPKPPNTPGKKARVFCSLTCKKVPYEQSIGNLKSYTIGTPAKLKMCVKCGCDKPSTNFDTHRKDALTGKWTRRNVCKSCRGRKVKRVHNRKELIRCYLLQHPCVDCGESNPIVLEFDHRDPSKKEGELSSISQGMFEEELDKCDVRCANCHRIRHAKLGMNPISPFREIVVNKTSDFYKASTSGPLPITQMKVYAA